MTEERKFIKIEANVEERYIKVGNKYIRQYERHSWESLAHFALDGEGFYLQHKEGLRNKQLTKLLGVTPKKFLKVYIACVNKVWLDPLRENGLINYCFINGRIHPSLVNKVWRLRYELLSTPKQLRVFVRKWGDYYNWPTDAKCNYDLLYKNSEERNKAILTHIERHGVVDTCKFDTTILKLCKHMKIENISKIRKWYPKGKKKLTKKYVKDLNKVINDFNVKCYLMKIHFDLPDDFKEASQLIQDMKLMYKAYVEISQ